jgi:hypothetical protein
MMTPDERLDAIKRMKLASQMFYAQATSIGVHPFIEFTGLVNEYINCCERAHALGVDFSECNVHSGKPLPMAGYQVAYVNEKLECIFTGTSVMQAEALALELASSQAAHG